MKKLFYICIILMGVMAFTSCKKEQVEVVEEETLECAVDSTEVLETPADTLVVVEE